MQGEGKKNITCSIMLRKLGLHQGCGPFGQKHCCSSLFQGAVNFYKYYFAELEQFYLSRAQEARAGERLGVDE